MYRLDSAGLYSKCRNEQDFKMLYIKTELKGRYNDVFCIESEQTVHGFPDVMTVNYSNGCLASFYEFKVSDASGRIKFQPTQPAFYRRHPEMDVKVVALNRKTRAVHLFSANNLSNEYSAYRLDATATVDLCMAEAL